MWALKCWKAVVSGLTAALAPPPRYSVELIGSITRRVNGPPEAPWMFQPITAPLTGETELPETFVLKTAKLEPISVEV